MTHSQSTDLTYLADAYCASCEATVIGADGDGAWVALDRTVFYPGGGGQPADHGTMSWDGADGRRVLEVKRSGAVVRHALDAGSLPQVGTVVRVEIDWERRHMLMRTHSAMHVLCGVMWNEFGAGVTGHNLGPGEGRCDFELDSVAGAFGQVVEQRMNEEIVRDLPISSDYVPRSAVSDDPALIRSKADLIPASIDPLRVVTIEGLDRQADSGTHVRSTAEIGRVRVTKTESKGAANKRIRIAVDAR